MKRPFVRVCRSWAMCAQIMGLRAKAIAENQALFSAMVRDIDEMYVLHEPQLGVVAFDASPPGHRGFARAFAARGHRGKPIRHPGGFVVCIGPERGAQDLDRYESEIRRVLAQVDGAAIGDGSSRPSA